MKAFLFLILSAIGILFVWRIVKNWSKPDAKDAHFNEVEGDQERGATSSDRAIDVYGVDDGYGEYPLFDAANVNQDLVAANVAAGQFEKTNSLDASPKRVYGIREPYPSM